MANFRAAKSKAFVSGKRIKAQQIVMFNGVAAEHDEFGMARALNDDVAGTKIKPNPTRSLS